MITRQDCRGAQQRAAQMIREAGLPIREDEVQAIGVADFGLSRLDVEGAQILAMVDTERISVKVIVLFPGQTLPEHWHPPVGDDPGKEETVRTIRGTLHLYVPGEENTTRAPMPAGREPFYMARHEVILGPGEQFAVPPGTKHWLRAGPQGVVAFSFSSTARDILDGFSDPNIRRQTVIEEHDAT